MYLRYFYRKKIKQNKANYYFPGRLELIPITEELFTIVFVVGLGLLEAVAFDANMTSTYLIGDSEAL